MLDQHIDRLVQDRVDGVPSEAEFREALLALDAVEPTETMRLLIEHSRLPGGVATMGDLVRRSSRDEDSAVTDYARLGREVGTMLNFAPGPDGLERSLAPLLTFSVLETSSDGASVKQRLRPEVLAALGATLQGDARN